MRFKSVVSCIVPVVFLVMAGCSSSHDSGSQGTGGIMGSLLPLTGPLAKGHTPEDVKAFLSSRDWRRGVGDGGVERVHRVPGEILQPEEDPGMPKYSPRAHGHALQHGPSAARLRPGHTYEMLTRFMRIIGLEQLKQIGIAVDPFCKGSAGLRPPLLYPAGRVPGQRAVRPGGPQVRDAGGGRRDARRRVSGRHL